WRRSCSRSTRTTRKRALRPGSRTTRTSSTTCCDRWSSITGCPRPPMAVGGSLFATLLPGGSTSRSRCVGLHGNRALCTGCTPRTVTRCRAHREPCLLSLPAEPWLLSRRERASLLRDVCRACSTAIGDAVQRGECVGDDGLARTATTYAGQDMACRGRVAA